MSHQTFGPDHVELGAGAGLLALNGDLRLASDGAIPANGMMDWMNGREGQFVLVNGARRPLIVMATNEHWKTRWDHLDVAHRAQWCLRAHGCRVRGP